MRIEVVTLFPPLMDAGLSAGVVGRAVQSGRVGVGFENPRDHAQDAHRTVDDRPFGGGPGMVMKAEPLAKAIGAVRARLPAGSPVIGLAAQGVPFGQAGARRLAGLPGFALVAVPLAADARERLIEICRKNDDRSRGLADAIHALATLPEFQLS